MYLKRFNLVVDGGIAHSWPLPQRLHRPKSSELPARYASLCRLCCSRYTGPLVLTVLCCESLVANQREPLPLERTQTAAGKAASSEVVDATSTTVEAATPLVKAAEAPAF